MIIIIIGFHLSGGRPSWSGSNRDGGGAEKPDAQAWLHAVLRPGRRLGSLRWTQLGHVISKGRSFLRLQYLSAYAFEIL